MVVIVKCIPCWVHTLQCVFSVVSFNGAKAFQALAYKTCVDGHQKFETNILKNKIFLRTNKKTRENTITCSHFLEMSQADCSHFVILVGKNSGVHFKLFSHNWFLKKMQQFMKISQIHWIIKFVMNIFFCSKKEKNSWSKYTKSTIIFRKKLRKINEIPQIITFNPQINNFKLTSIGERMQTIKNFSRFASNWDHLTLPISS